MERCLCFHRFAALSCLLICFTTVASANDRPNARANAARRSGQDLPASSPSPEAQTAPSGNSNHRKTEEFTLSHERYEKAVAYSRAGYALYFVSVFLTALVLILVLRLGIAARFRDFSENLTDKRWLQAVVFVPLLLITLDILNLPIRAYGHSLSLRYEVSVQGWRSWFWDCAKQAFLGIVLALILTAILTGVMRRSPRRWWVYSWFATLPVLLFFLFIAPWFIDPMFAKFEPLGAKHGELVAAIEKLTNHAGVPIPPERMFLMKASEKTTTINAYVTGLGASKRVVIWDTTIQRLTTEEALFVVGHELGHYVLGHVKYGFGFFSALLLVAFYGLFRGLHWALGRWGSTWKIYGPEDWASLAVLLLILHVLFFLASPIKNGFTRMQERAADIYGVEVIHGIVPDSSEVAAHAFQELGDIDLADPNPPAFITFWLYSHPPLADRLVFAYTYDPWSKGESPKYVK